MEERKGDYRDSSARAEGSSRAARLDAKVEIARRSRLAVQNKRRVFLPDCEDDTDAGDCRLEIPDIGPCFSTDPRKAIHAIWGHSFEDQDCPEVLNWIEPLLTIYHRMPALSNDVLKTLAKISQVYSATPCYYTRVMHSMGVSRLLLDASDNKIAARALGNIIVDVWEENPQDMLFIVNSLLPVLQTRGALISPDQLWCFSRACMALDESSDRDLVYSAMAAMVGPVSAFGENQKWDVYYSMKYLVTIHRGSLAATVVTSEFCQNVIISILTAPASPVALTAAALLTSLCQSKEMTPMVAKANPQAMYESVIGTTSSLDEMLLCSAAAFVCHCGPDSTFNHGFISIVLKYAEGVVVDASKRVQSAAAWTLGYILMNSTLETTQQIAIEAVEVLHKHHLQPQGTDPGLVDHILNTFLHCLANADLATDLVSLRNADLTVSLTASVLACAMQEMKVPETLERMSVSENRVLRLRASQLLDVLSKTEQQEDMSVDDGVPNFYVESEGWHTFSF